MLRASEGVNKAATDWNAPLDNHLDSPSVGPVDTAWHVFETTCPLRLPQNGLAALGKVNAPAACDAVTLQRHRDRRPAKKLLVSWLATLGALRDAGAGTIRQGGTSLRALATPYSKSLRPIRYQRPRAAEKWARRGASSRDL